MGRRGAAVVVPYTLAICSVSVGIVMLFPVEPSNEPSCTCVGMEVGTGKVGLVKPVALFSLGPLEEELRIVWSVGETKLNCSQGDRIFFHCPMRVSFLPCP